MALALIRGMGLHEKRGMLLDILNSVERAELRHELEWYMEQGAI
jgi:hypothetical protein